MCKRPGIQSQFFGGLNIGGRRIRTNTKNIGGRRIHANTYNDS